MTPKDNERAESRDVPSFGSPMTPREYRSAARMAALWNLDPRKAEEFERLAREAEGQTDANVSSGRPRTTGSRGGRAHQR